MNDEQLVGIEYQDRVPNHRGTKNNEQGAKNNEQRTKMKDRESELSSRLGAGRESPKVGKLGSQKVVKHRAQPRNL